MPLSKSIYSNTFRIDWELYGRVLEARSQYTDDELMAMRDRQKLVVSLKTKRTHEKSNESTCEKKR